MCHGITHLHKHSEVSEPSRQPERQTHKCRMGVGSLCNQMHAILIQPHVLIVHCCCVMQAEAENTQRMVLEMKTERDRLEARLLEAQQDIGEGTSRERDIQEQLLKADQVSHPLMQYRLCVVLAWSAEHCCQV